MKTVSSFVHWLPLFLILCSCSSLVPREEPTSVLKQKIARPKVPAWAEGRIAPRWWEGYHDPELNNDITIAYDQSPDLQAVAARLEQADAQVQVAKAAAWPSLNLGYGFRFGRTKEVDFGPYNLAPWAGSANLKWELDIFHRLRRARESAEFNRRAVFWELAGAKLILFTRIAEARFRIYRFREEIEVLSEALDANNDILEILRDREKAGLISETEVHRMVAEDEKLTRAKDELIRLQLLAEVELDTLKGGAERDCDVKGRLPELPEIPCRSFSEMIGCHPSLLEGESRLRAAFRTEESARLNLLPSFTLQGSLMGASPHFFLDQYKSWQREVGPSLDIPIFDPARKSTLKARRAQTDEAVAEFRSALVRVVGDVDSSYYNLESRKRQYQSVIREVDALVQARKHVTVNFKAGLVSQVEVLESERSHLQAMRAKVVLQEAILTDHVALIRSLGGGSTETCLPKITARPVIKQTLAESLLMVKPDFTH